MSVYQDRYRPKSEHDASLDSNKAVGTSFVNHSSLNFPKPNKRSSSENKFSSPHKKRSYSLSPSKENKRRSYVAERVPYTHIRRGRRSKSSSNDIIFVERRHRHGGHKPRHIPPDFEYRGKLKVSCMDKRIDRVPCMFPQSPPMAPPMPQYYPEPMPPPMPPPPPPPFSRSYLPPLICDPPVMLGDYQMRSGYFESGSVDMWPDTYSGGVLEGSQSQFGGSFGSSNYPPIPPGGKLIAQYVKDFDEVSYMPPPAQPMPMPPPPGPPPPMRPPSMYPCERIVEKCVPRSKYIEVWRKSRKSKSKECPSIDELRKDLIDSITSEIKKIEFADRRPPARSPRPVQPVEREVKVIVQPIQPVFYMPKQEPVQTIIPQPPPQMPAPAPPPPPPPPQPPSIVYVPRNVYVPVIKPVFVPRERVIVRPQIVQVARPVVIDRPVPVAQRPIVIDRELPIPFPVGNRMQPVGETVQEQYIYRDNLPLAYGGRTGEFATGMNYGYVPVNENYQYVVSGCDDLFREQLVRGSAYDHRGHIVGDCFDQAIAEAESNHAGYVPPIMAPPPPPPPAGLHIPVNIIQSPPTHFADPISIAHQNRNALVETLRRAGTGCTNLEVLDPTIRPGWEPIDAKVLIQRYGQSAAGFVQSGVSYGYVTSPINRVESVASGRSAQPDDANSDEDNLHLLRLKNLSERSPLGQQNKVAAKPPVNDPNRLEYPETSSSGHAAVRLATKSPGSETGTQQQQRRHTHSDRQKHQHQIGSF